MIFFVIFAHISTKRGDRVYLLSCNGCVKFHAKIRNSINKSIGEGVLFMLTLWMAKESKKSHDGA